MTLYTYCKSSAAYRVRIALNLKGLTYHPVYISLIKEGGENFRPEYRAINPQAMVPTLQTGKHTLTQSTAIVEYLEEEFPDPPLLPDNAAARAQARSYAQMFACDIHPINNLRVLDYLVKHFDADETAKLQWHQHWMHEGFGAIETKLASNALTGRFCVGDTPTIADVFLVPQVYNAKRYHCKLDAYPNIRRINDHCLELEAFIDAAPEQQADFTA
ncbi:MAG: maleylacetoacetate isomerase [Gammaproteobacteria bacterium]|nr:maleylacetoacetate isomerase [Gammaproteobacteria bacterium]